MEGIITTRADLRLWQLISAALPVGAFHYSQGLETAVTRAWVHDADSAQHWIAAGLRYTLGGVDLPLLARIWQSWRQTDAGAVVHWDTTLRACRETAELRAEDVAMGQALAMLADSWQERRPPQPLGYTTLFGVLAANNGIELSATLHGYAWAWCENATLAATRLLPLGHLQGQGVLRAVSLDIDAVVAEALRMVDDEIGAGLPGVWMASVWHEQQYTRLYRS